MATSNISSLLRDVVAYVDVWSGEKTANYSDVFIQQLEEMGAQVPKRFTKQVTHVIFHNGHPATWSKAKSTNVKLVSVLWVGRCFDHCERADEELFPALKETNPEFKNKKHRCMQGKDSPRRTLENDRRIKKKLDMMMKDRLPKQPKVSDVSPIIIDEENGIVYSPGLKRSDYMEARLREMKEKRENLSPTASQKLESCSPTGLKPSLGSTPTVLKLTFDQSDDNSSAAAEPAVVESAAAEPAHSANGDDDVFEDFFSSPAHCRQKAKRATCSSLPMDTNIEIPFELGSVGKKRKPRRSGLETSSKKKKVDESEGERERPSVPWREDEETLECRSANVTPVVKRLRQSTLSFPNTRSTNSAAKRRASTSSLSIKTTETGSPAELQRHSAASVHSQILESE